MTKKKKVILVGGSKVTRDLVPWDAEDTEFWHCNESYVLEPPKVDRWFQIHSFATFSRADNHNDPNHYKWLQEDHDFPIYMQEKYPNIPASVRYPREEAIALFGGYATSTFAYMLQLAVVLEFEWIGIYGFDMASETEYMKQRANAEYLIGYARGLGYEVYVPNESTLLSGPVYGYDDSTVALRQQLETRASVLVSNMERLKGEFWSAQGAATVLEELSQQISDPHIVEMTNAWQTKAVETSTTISKVAGAQQEVKLMIQILDGVAGRKVA